MEHPLIKFQNRHGLTQGQLADRLGMGQPAVSRLCAGKRRPRLDTILRIHEATGISLDEWVAWEAASSRAEVST